MLISIKYQVWSGHVLSSSPVWHGQGIPFLFTYLNGKRGRRRGDGENSPHGPPPFSHETTNHSTRLHGQTRQKDRPGVQFEAQTICKQTLISIIIPLFFQAQRICATVFVMKGQWHASQCRSHARKHGHDPSIHQSKF